MAVYKCITATCTFRFHHGLGQLYLKVGGTEGNYRTLNHSIPLDSSPEMISIWYHCSNQHVRAALLLCFYSFHFGWHHHHHHHHEWRFSECFQCARHCSRCSSYQNPLTPGTSSLFPSSREEDRTHFHRGNIHMGHPPVIFFSYFGVKVPQAL